jgi:hypothetical protein
MLEVDNPAMKQQFDMEALADVQHEIWSHWMRYLFSVSSANADGSYTIPAEKVQHWRRQLQTPYSQLSEAEKESDREQAAKMLEVLTG